MELGMIARADQSGLGVQTWEFFQHMHPDKVMLIDVSSEYGPGDENKKIVFSYPGDFCKDVVVRGWEPTPNQIEGFLDGLDVVYTAETFYGYDIIHRAKQRGIRTYVHTNPEFCWHMVNPLLPKPTSFLAPTRWLLERLPDPKQVLPFPVATERFNEMCDGRCARDECVCPMFPPTNFLHVIGRPAAYDRSGTPELLRALQYVTAPITLTIRCLQADYVDGLLDNLGLPPSDNVTLVVDTSDVRDYWDLYQGQHVLVAPRRWGGMSLPVQEAMGAGMPVIMGSHDVYARDAAQRVPVEWAVPSRHASWFPARTRVDIFSVDPKALAAKIDQFATDTQTAADGYEAAREWAATHSWEALKPAYDSLFAGSEL
jgi:glycosyltransferase involved in cell wall biosynthesis